MSSQNWNDQTIEEEIHRRALYESEADKLLAEGGINAKSVSAITETAKRIKEHMDSRISKVLEEETKIEPTYFIQCRALYKLWKDVFKGRYSTNPDIFRQGFSFKFGSDILTEARMEGFKQLVQQGKKYNMPKSKSGTNTPTGSRSPKKMSMSSRKASHISEADNLASFPDVPEELMLYDLVNLTDFMTLTDAFELFEINRLELCDEAVRNENSKNYEFELREVELHNLAESLRGKHLAKSVNTTKTGNTTLFVRSKMQVTANPRLLLLLYIFGMQTVHQNSDTILHKLATKLGFESQSNDIFDAPKLYGLYRTGENHITKGAD